MGPVSRNDIMLYIDTARRSASGGAKLVLSDLWQQLHDGAWDVQPPAPAGFEPESAEPKWSNDGREPSRRLDAVLRMLELLFDSDAFDSTWGLTPAAQHAIDGLLKRFRYKLERVR